MEAILKRFIVMVIIIFTLLGTCVYADITSPGNGSEVEVNDLGISWSGDGEHHVEVTNLTKGGVVVSTTATSSYVISGPSLSNGCVYKIVVYPLDDPSNVSESHFATAEKEKLPPPIITYPAPYEVQDPTSASVSWSSDATQFLVSLKDLTENEVIVSNASVTGSSFSFISDKMTFGHRYEVSVTAIEGSERSTSSVEFLTKEEPIVLRQPQLSESSHMKYNLDDVRISWASVDLADNYSVTVRDVTDNYTVISNDQVTSTSYKIPVGALTAKHKYTYTVTANKDNVSSQSTATFEILEGEDKNPDISYPFYNAKYPSTSSIWIEWNGIKDASYYLVSIMDMTDNTMIYEKVDTSELRFDINKDLLIYGHQYKISLGAIVNGNEFWDHSYFSWEYPELKSPTISNIKNNSNVASRDFEVRWQASVEPEHYHVTLKNISSNSNTVDENVNTPHYLLSKAMLSSGQSYELIVTVNREGKSLTKGVKFKVTSVEVASPYLKTNKIYSKEMAIFNWPDVDGTSGYKISLHDDTSDKILLESVQITDSSFIIPSSILIDGREYTLTVDAYNYSSKASSTASFKVGDVTYDDIEQNISSWAKPYTDSVFGKGLLGYSFAEDLLENPQENLTRVEFCRMLIGLFDKHCSKQVDLDMAKPFEDIGHLTTAEQNAIKKANVLGIISGVSEKEFNPDGLVSRQEMAVMLYNTYKCVKEKSASNMDWKDSFSDVGSIAPWAQESVKVINANDVLSGDGVNFNPLNNATREMGFVLISKSHDWFLFD